MTLVDYPSSGSEADDAPPPTIVTNANTATTATTSRKRKHGGDSGARGVTPLPPLPSTFHSLYATNVRSSTNDDPALHDGRKRQIPHTEGNWPTHIYLEWYPSNLELRLLESLIARIGGDSSLARDRGDVVNYAVNSLLQSNLGAQLPLHVSLSAPVVLQTEQKALFVEAITTAVEVLDVRPFAINVTGLDWVPNYEHSRWFLVLRLSRPESDALNTLLRLCNQNMGEIGLPVLYDNQLGPVLIGSEPSAPRLAGRRVSRIGARNSSRGARDCSSSFHISIAWMLEEPSDIGRIRTGALEEIFADIKNWTIKFDCIKLKIGNVIKDILFSRRGTAEKGIEGT